jgi:multiple sugar transport system substrate-binding protein
LLQQFSSEVPRTFSDVLIVAHRARDFGKFVVVPACPTDAISLFFTLSANLGHPIAEASDIFIDDAVGKDILDRLHRLISAAHPNSVEWNPIQVYDFMISTSDAIYCPYGFGYSNYSRADRPVRLKFADAPAAGPRGCAGTMLGGTGIAISGKSAQQQKAVEYAKWVVSRQHQCGTYFCEGGQPASLSAWMDPAIDSAASGFFSGTLQTLQTAYLRPRFDGFVRFFESAGTEINKCLRGLVGDADLLAWLNARYATQRARLETA